MAEYIEREAAIKCAEESYKMWCLAMAAADGEREINKCYKMQDVCNAIAEVFKIVTAADVAPVVHGRWVYHNFDTICSECRKSAIFDEWEQQAETEFCPHCGAKMGIDEEV